MCLFVGSASNAQSQNFRKAFEMGFMGGGSYYIGDINPNKHFIYSKPAFGVIEVTTSNFLFEKIIIKRNRQTKSFKTLIFLEKLIFITEIPFNFPVRKFFVLQFVITVIL